MRNHARWCTYCGPIPPPAARVPTPAASISTTSAATARHGERDLDLSRAARTYSAGNQQKVALVAAFATRARLLVLDEPTSGLDH
ncbi:ATP-binding cassette domain-containing protein [Micromonospora sp. GCM10011542]|uniref:ATP-binding cassette domain-containing protein n=1 Tax=Micromonospora sp. GCM10011542 TaxID=3317337 RepID=UPI003612BD9C